jgi:hypothetical protein
MAVAGGTVTLLNDTLSFNSAKGGNGGGGADDPSFPISKGLLAGGNGGNGQGGGLYVASNGSTALFNTLIAENSLTAGWGGSAAYGRAGYLGSTSGPDVSGTVAYSDHDLIGNSKDFVAIRSNGDLVDLTSNQLKGLLDPKGLKDNGGPTQTIALPPGSLAIDAGDSSAAVPNTDQRGFARISGAAVDIGAFEVQEPIFNTSALPDGTYGTKYSQTITATATGGAAGPFTFAVTGGSLPPGLSLASDGTLSGTPTAAGVYSFTIMATDSDSDTGSQSYTLMIDKATPTVSVADAGGTYNGNAFPASATALGVDGTTPVAGSFSYAYYTGSSATGTSSATAPTNAGTYTVVATFTSSDSNYAGGSAQTTFTISPATPTVSVTDGGTYNGNAFNAVGSAVGVDGQTAVAGSFSYTYYASDGTTVLNGAPTNAGSYVVVAAFTSSDPNYTNAGSAQTAFTISPAPLVAQSVNFSATAGAPFTGTVATFTNPVSVLTAASYTALITWGDGSTSAGVISGTGSTLTVTGSHTFAAPVNETVSVQISNILGNTTTATVTDTATVTSLGLPVTHGLGQGIGFWQYKLGQALITSFNGGATSTALANWLAATFPNLYGASAGSNDLAGQTNVQVGAFFQTEFKLGGTEVQAQVLATALNVYATTASLGGTAGAAYGFTVSATGLGARSFNVFNFGAAFGVANKTTLNVYQLLLAVNQMAVDGVLYGGNATLQVEAAELFNAINGIGSSR